MNVAKCFLLLVSSNPLSNLSCSSTLEVSDDVGSVLGVGDAGEGHGISRGEARGALQPLVEVTVGPLERGLGRQGSRVGETFAGRNVLAWKTTEGRSNRVRLQ